MKRKKMKRVITMLLACVVIALVQGTGAKAEEAAATEEILISGEYQYTVLEDGTVSIAKYTGTSSVVRIPETIAGKKVTVIGKVAFSNNLNLNTVYFPSGVKKVLTGAFRFCSNLHYVYLNNGLQHIANSSFAHCDLYNIKIPSTVTSMEDLIFVFNKNLEKAELTNGVLTVGEMMFSECSKLKYIKVGSSVCEILTNALESCIEFKGFTTDKIPEYDSEYLIIPSHILLLEHGSFEKCSNLKKYVIINSNSSLDWNCIPENAIILGYKNSTAERYAQAYDHKFIEFVQTKQIVLNHNNLNLQLGGTQTGKLIVNYSPNNTTIKEVVWTSSNPKVATVDKSGNVKAIANGTATISARTFDESNLKQECKVTVTTKLEGISLNSKELSLDLSNKNSANLKAVAMPSQASMGTVAWKSSNTKIVTVNSNGKVKAKGVGKAKVTATVNGMSKACTVYVAPKQAENFKITESKPNSLTLSWSKVKGASGYKVYAYSEKTKGYVYIKNCPAKSNSCSLTKLEGQKLTSAKRYKLKVCSYVKIDDKKIKGGYSYLKGYTLPDQTNLISLKRKKSGKSIKASWKKVSRVAYYEVWISQDKNKGYKCVKQTKATSYTVNKLSKNKKYYVKVRAVADVNGKKIKGNFSASKSR